MAVQHQEGPLLVWLTSPQHCTQLGTADPATRSADPTVPTQIKATAMASCQARKADGKEGREMRRQKRNEWDGPTPILLAARRAFKKTLMSPRGR